ncbi:glutathione S-transferase family protein, partial [Paracoccus yeei]|uniref:glutathione S-transferase family protein n=1 Tax=Paracoccus yeei TaxID=147645 RepID=UPI0037D094F9
VTGPLDCAVAQGARLALARRGWPTGAAGQAQATGLMDESQPDFILTIEDPAAMIELIEDLHPGHPLHPRDPAARARHRELIALVGAARAELGRVTAARNLRDLDIAVFALRETLARLDRGIAGETGAALTNLDLVLAPVLWRAAILDRRFGLHLGDGLAACRTRIAQAYGQPPVRAMLDRAAGSSIVRITSGWDSTSRRVAWACPAAPVGQPRRARASRAPCATAQSSGPVTRNRGNCRCIGSASSSPRYGARVAQKHDKSRRVFSDGFPGRSVMKLDGFLAQDSPPPRARSRRGAAGRGLCHCQPRPISTAVR